MNEIIDNTCYLNWYEVSVAIHIAGLRNIESLRKGLKDNHGYTGRDLQDNLYGVLGEMAFAKICNRYFPMTVNTFKGADIGDKWQIRTVGSNKNRNLIIRFADPDSHYYALIDVSKRGDNYKAVFKGWIRGKEAKLAKYLTDFGYEKRPKVFKVPDSALKTTSWFPF